jgi:hypothetical protein
MSHLSHACYWLAHSILIMKYAYIILQGMISWHRLTANGFYEYVIFHIRQKSALLFLSAVEAEELGSR